MNQLVIACSFIIAFLGIVHANRWCKDKYSYPDCFFYKKNGYCQSHPETLSKHCARTCNLCDYGKPKRHYCTDKGIREHCQFFKDEGLCHTHKNLMAEKCARTCNLCDLSKKCASVNCPVNQICLLNRRGEPTCKCPHYCPYKDAYKKLGNVCGTDGKTYKDFCHMKHHSCRGNNTLNAAFYGVCFKDKPCEDSKLESESGTCQSWKAMGLCKNKNYQDVMKKYCMKTCNLCPEARLPYPQYSCHSSPYGCCWDWQPKPAPGKGKCKECKNRYTNLCPRFISLCNSVIEKNQNFMRSSCPEVCGYCSPGKIRKHEVVREYRGEGKYRYKLQLKRNRSRGK